VTGTLLRIGCHTALAALSALLQWIPIMANDRFELSPGKSNWVRVFTLEGTIEFESPDSQTAEVLLNLLNVFVSDIVIDRHQSPSAETAPRMDWLYV